MILGAQVRMVEEMPLPAMAAARDDASAMAVVVALHSALLYRLAYSVLRNPAEAEDVVQETFLRALKSGEKFFDLNEPRQWLVRVAWNLALDRKRRVAPQQMDEVFAAALVDGAASAETQLADARSLAQVMAAMERLPKLEQHVLVLSAMEELDVGEIALLVKRSPAAVRGLMFRARAKLREMLDGGKPNSGKPNGGKEEAR